MRKQRIERIESTPSCGRRPSMRSLPIHDEVGWRGNTGHSKCFAAIYCQLVTDRFLDGVAQELADPPLRSRRRPPCRRSDDPTWARRPGRRVTVHYKSPTNQFKSSKLSTSHVTFNESVNNFEHKETEETEKTEATERLSLHPPCWIPFNVL